MKYVGVDIGGTNLKAGLADENGQLLAVQKMKVASVTDQQSLAWTIVAMTRELAKSAGVPLDDIASVGVGVPGTVEIRSGSIGYTCNLPLRNVPLRKLFHHYLSIPLYIENDANCAALAEYYVGAGRDSKRFVTITLGTGVGAGIIHNGKVYHGANGMAGEVGHTVIIRTVCRALRPPRLLGAVRLRHGAEADDGRGAGGPSGQHPCAGGGGERRPRVRPVRIYRGTAG